MIKTEKTIILLIFVALLVLGAFARVFTPGSTPEPVEVVKEKVPPEGCEYAPGVEYLRPYDCMDQSDKDHWDLKTLNK